MRNAAVFAALLVAALVAGCSTPTDNPSTSSSSTSAAPPVVASELKQPTVVPPVLLGSPGGGAEPNIAVAPDGTLYISSPLAVWRSDDGGKTWSETASDGLTGGGDGDIAVDAHGNVYWLGLFGDVGPVPFQVSRDNGESWGKAVDISEKSGFDREWIDVTPDGQVYATWRGSGGLEFRSSPDGGNTWGKKVVVGLDGDEGPVTHDAATGELYIADADQAATAGTGAAGLYVYSSSDGGTKWVQHKVAEIPRTSPVEPNAYASDFPVTAVDGNGTVYVVWSSDATGLPAGAAPPEELALYGVYLSVSKDHGVTWSAPRLLSPQGKDARFPWIAAGASGRVAVVWYENVLGIPGETLPDEWNVKLWESITADSAAPTAVVAMLTSTPNHVGSLCTSGTGCAAADRSMLDFFEVAIAPNGQPVVAFAATATPSAGPFGNLVSGTDVYFGTVSGTSLL